MGPLAQNFFHDIKNTPKITNPNILDTFTREGRNAYTRGRENHKLTSLFRKSNKGYRKTHKDSWYGSTYQLINPSDWGKHNLALNTNLAILKHIKKGLNIVLKHNLQAEKIIIKKQANRLTLHPMKSHIGKQKLNGKHFQVPPKYTLLAQQKLIHITIATPPPHYMIHTTKKRLLMI